MKVMARIVLALGLVLICAVLPFVVYADWLTLTSGSWNPRHCETNGEYYARMANQHEAEADFWDDKHKDLFWACPFCCESLQGECQTILAGGNREIAGKLRDRLKPR